MYENIPVDLRRLNQWVVSNEDKVPKNPRTGWKASPTDPNTWVSFEEAAKSGFKHIGFVLTDADPYTIIDLDNKPEKPLTQEQQELHSKILKTFESYTERSASGRGYHIIVKGKVPEGVHSRDFVEVYSSKHYLICTGNVVRQAPIADYQPLLNQLYGEIKTVKAIALEDRDDVLDDTSLVQMAMNAENKDKFNSLCNGDWQALGYPSQSEADYALLAMLAFYSPSNEQVRRLFRYSKLGQREKALKNNIYLDRCLSKIRAVQGVPKIDLTSLANKAAETMVKDPTPPVVPPAEINVYGETPALQENSNGYPVPPGLVGELAHYIFSSSVRPVPEVSLAAALGLMAGVSGRAYNVSNTGLNLYLILLAKTGSGKEGAAAGIDRMISACRTTVPMIDQFLGPAHFASGQALLKTFADHPCYLSVLGEFGLTLQQLCDPRANNAEKLLKKALLDLYTKSGINSFLRGMQYSDKEKNIEVVQAPAITLLGESTPEAFFEGLDLSHITGGLIPRFSVIEYSGKRPPINDYANAPPDSGLVQRFNDIAVKALACIQNNTSMPVAIEPSADQMLRRFGIECDERINSETLPVDIELWNRAHLKVLKLSSLISVGINHNSPIVTPECVEWSIAFTRKDISTISGRYRSGDVGIGSSKQIADLKRVIHQYLNSPYEAVKRYEVEKLMYEQRVIPYTYLQRRTAALASFKSDRRGASPALKATIQELIDAGNVIEIGKSDVHKKYNSTAVCYVVIKAWNS